MKRVVITPSRTASVDITKNMTLLDHTALNGSEVLLRIVFLRVDVLEGFVQELSKMEMMISIGLKTIPYVSEASQNSKSGVGVQDHHSRSQK